MKFSTTFSPRNLSSYPENFIKISRKILETLSNVLEKSIIIIESVQNSASHSTPNKNYYPVSKSPRRLLESNDNYQETFEIIYDIEDFERRIIENLEFIQKTIETLGTDLRVLDQELRNSKNFIINEESFEELYKNNEKLIRENENLQQEIERIKEGWSFELQKAQNLWNDGLDKMKATYESTIKEISEAHLREIENLKSNHQQEISKNQKLHLENEKNLIEKLENMNTDQSSVLNKLNDKIIFLSSKNNDDLIFIEKISNFLDDVFEKFSMKNKNYRTLHEKIFYQLEVIDTTLEKLKKGDPTVAAKNIKLKLNRNVTIMKEFEEARSNLIKHFSGSPKKIDTTSLTSRY